MTRYRLPDPKCSHPRRGIVTAGGAPGEAHAATNVCDRQDCIADAIEWARAVTHLPAQHRRDGAKRLQDDVGFGLKTQATDR